MQSPKEHKDISLERIIFFSDAVIAIAITILALEIRVPEHIRDLNDLFPAMIPQIVAYIFGFLQIAIFWSAHHALFKKLVDYDGNVIWLNLGFLMIIGFLPVPIALIIKLGVTTGAIVFIYVCLMLLGLIELIFWRYVATVRQHLLHSSVTKEARVTEAKKIGFMVLLFAIGILIAFASPYVAVATGLIIPFVHRLIERQALPKASKNTARRQSTTMASIEN